MTSSEISALLLACRALVGIEFAGADGAGLVESLRALESCRRMLDLVDANLLAEVESARVAAEFCRSSTADLLIADLQLAPGEAKARVQRAGDVGPRRTLTGEPLPALMPATAASMAAGEISAAHAAVIADCLDEFSTASMETVQVVETTLVELAGHEHPGRLRKSAAVLLARVEPDALEPRLNRIERRRSATLPRNEDGSGRLSARLTPEATAIWDTLLDALSAPSGGDEPDTRTAAQRRHDALVEVGQRVLRAGTLPAAGGVPVTVLVRTTPADLAATMSPDPRVRPRGVGSTMRDDLLTLEAVIACGDAEIVPVLLDEHGAVLRLGRTRRLASTAQRIALAARDGGCSFPACDRPPGWTEAHHVVPWTPDGPTDVDNMTLVCRFHHREFDRRGWQVRMIDGMPEWIPPAWVDPAQGPRRNHVHHRCEIYVDGPLRAA